MSSLGSPSSGSPTGSVSNEALAAAAELRTRQAAPQLTAAQMAAEHEKRQKFRRLLDPGITRPNSKEQALNSLKTLLAITENLLREPNNPKFQQFKPTNPIIKRDLVDPKGALEFAIELGFRGEVQNFQPYYTFNQRHMEDLRIGSSILKDYIGLETQKQERAAQAKKNQKASIEAAAEKVKLAFMDDRRSKLLRDEMEKEQRAALALTAARQVAIQELSPNISHSTTSESAMPGSGHVLGFPMTNPDEPPVYEDILDSD
ncbi:hypothetical protein BYT27DRAFT_7087790 [Phlegmacium glaucopus]|nr:hypothetical protein BYT27DRAFT_7087790 [Phlegmacium glaucopus]